MAGNRTGWVARDRSAVNLIQKKPAKTIRHGFTFPILASDSCRKLLTAEDLTVRAGTAVLEYWTVSFNGRDRPADHILVYGKSIRIVYTLSFFEKCTV